VAKKKKGKNKQKKNLNKVVRLDEHREKEMVEDLDHYSLEELEELRLALPAGDLLWKMAILHLVEDYHMGGDLGRAWDTLGELLDHIMDVEKGGRSASALSLETKANLLAFVTAAGLRYALEDGGDTSGTAHWVNEAMGMMQYYDRRQGKHQPLPADWVGLTEETMKLTALLGHNEKLLEIYRTLGRLCKGALPHYLAGTAAFNLKEYGFAAKCWEKMNRAEKYPEGLLYANIAGLVDEGTIPPFTMDYEEETGFMKMRSDQIRQVYELGDFQKEKKQQLGEDHYKEIVSYLNRGVALMAMLAEFYEATEAGAVQQGTLVADMLLINTGAWGLQLVRNLAQDQRLPQELREEMSQLLESKAAPEEEITLYGKLYKVLFEDKRLKATYEMASELRRRKRDDEAKDMIVQAMSRKKATNPDLVMLLSSMESASGHWQVSLDLMIELEKALPGNPAVLLNQVLAYYKLQKWNDALGVLEDLKMIVKREEAEGVEMASRYTSKSLEKLEKSIMKNRYPGREEGNKEEWITEEGIKEDRKKEDRIIEEGIIAEEIIEEGIITEGIIEGIKNLEWNNPENVADDGVLTAKELRSVVETKNLPKNTSLRRGMKNMPVEWLRFACLQYNLQEDGLREELETALEDTLASAASAESPEVLKKALEALDPAEKEVLQYLIKKGGTAGTGYLVRTYGSMDEDGYLWDEGDAPTSTLGRLWSKCLIMVGRGLVNGKRQKVALIPIDLLPHIQNHL